jgi:hypothetical protein
MEAFIREQVAFCAFQTPPGAVLLLIAVVGFLIQTFTRGVITAQVLHTLSDRGDAVSSLARLLAACRATAGRYSTLLCGALVCAMCLAAALAGLTPALQELKLDPSQIRSDIGPANAADLMGREMSALAVNELIPAPDPFTCVEAATLRVSALQQMTAVTRPTAQVLAYSYSPGSNFSLNLSSMPAFWPITLGSLVLMFLCETLLRFWAVATLAASGRNQGVIHTLRTMTRLGVHHMKDITVQVWLLRVVMACVQVLFLAAPTLIAERILIPRVAFTIGAPWMIQVCILLIVLGSAIARSIVSACVVVFDARLFVALRAAEV